MDAQKLKHLQTRISVHEAELTSLNARIADLNKEANSKRQQLASIKKEMDALRRSTSELIISEHAMLRFLERAGVVSLKAARYAMLPPDLEAQIKSVGNGVYPVQGFDLQMRVKDNVVITVEPSKREQVAKAV